MTPVKKPAAGHPAAPRETFSWRAVVDHAAEGVMVFRADASCLYLNPAARDLLGISSPADQFKAPAFWRDRIARVLEQRQPESFDEYITTDGRVCVADCTWAPWPDATGALAGVSVILRDVTERRRLAAERRLLAQRLLEVQEQERKNISQFLHDHMGPLILMAKMDLERVAPALASDQQQHLRQALGHMDEALRGIRHKALALRPPMLDDLAVKEALEFVVEDFVRVHNVPVDLTPVPPLPALSPAIKTCFFRILQEALSNVAAHAQATRAAVLVEQRDLALALVISDNGRGFVVQAVSPSRQLGLIGMREIVHSLGGDLLIQSEPGRGTRVEVVVPLEESERGGSL